MGVSLADCEILACQVGVRFFVEENKKLSGKFRKRYHVQTESGRSDFKTLNDAYAYMSGLALTDMYPAEWGMAFEMPKAPTLSDSDEVTLRRAIGVMDRWIEGARDADAVQDNIFDEAMDIRTMLRRFIEETSEGE